MYDNDILYKFAGGYFEKKCLFKGPVYSLFHFSHIRNCPCGVYIQSACKV